MNHLNEKIVEIEDSFNLAMWALESSGKSIFIESWKSGQSAANAFYEGVGAAFPTDFIGLAIVRYAEQSVDDHFKYDMPLKNNTKNRMRM